MDTSKNFVYFISYSGGPIKIGKAMDVKKRLAGLQTSTHETLIVLGVVRESDFTEEALHERFSHLRVRGEWFYRDAELTSFIRDNRQLLLFPETVAKVKDPIDVIPGETPYGPVQVIDGVHAGKFGYWDDDDEDEDVDLCAFCDEAMQRGVDLEDHECAQCVRFNYAVVYFGQWVDGYVLIAHDELRRLDDEEEIGRCANITMTLFPTMTTQQIGRVLETNDVATPIRDSGFMFPVEVALP